MRQAAEVIKIGRLDSRIHATGFGLRGLTSSRRQNLQTPGGFDVFYALTAVRGFALFHGVDNHANKDLTYFEQLSAASPSTLHGYAAGVVSTILPIEALVTFLLPINYLVAYPELFLWDHHNAASQGIFIYSIFAGKCFGWRATMLIMAAGFGISSMISTHPSLLAYEEEMI